GVSHVRVSHRQLLNLRHPLIKRSGGVFYWVIENYECQRLFSHQLGLIDDYHFTQFGLSFRA
ncbi:hypothetical protein KTJ38_10175, partial [Acinetobacter ursingii]|nr:hypothetical protein [Acinetobacter ursingii]